MLVELKREDLIALIKGSSISYAAMEIPLVAANGRYSGSYSRWDWNYSAFEDCSEELLWELYLRIKRTK